MSLRLKLTLIVSVIVAVAFAAFGGTAHAGTLALNVVTGTRPANDDFANAQPVAAQETVR